MKTALGSGEVSTATLLFLTHALAVGGLARTLRVVVAANVAWLGCTCVVVRVTVHAARATVGAAGVSQSVVVPLPKY